MSDFTTLVALAALAVKITSLLKYLSAGQVRLVPLLNEWAQREFAICFRKHKDLTPAAARLVEFLREQARASTQSGK